MSPVAQILLAGAGTYLIRVSSIVFADRAQNLPVRVETALTMIPPAVLSAITAQSLFFDDGAVRGFDEWYVAAAAAAAAFVSWRTRSVALCLLVGMVVLWVGAALA